MTVPVVWDKETNKIVNNESREIIRMFNAEFDAVVKSNKNFYPEDLRESTDKTIDAI